MSFLCRSGHYIQILEKKNFVRRLPPLRGLVNMTFLCTSRCFMWFLANFICKLIPSLTPQGVAVGNITFLHRSRYTMKLPGKFFCKLTSNPYPTLWPCEGWELEKWIFCSALDISFNFINWPLSPMPMRMGAGTWGRGSVMVISDGLWGEPKQGCKCLTKGLLKVKFIANGLCKIPWSFVRPPDKGLHKSLKQEASWNTQLRGFIDYLSKGFCEALKQGVAQSSKARGFTKHPIQGLH